MNASHVSEFCGASQDRRAQVSPSASALQMEEGNDKGMRECMQSSDSRVPHFCVLRSEQVMAIAARKPADSADLHKQFSR